MPLGPRTASSEKEPLRFKRSLSLSVEEGILKLEHALLVQMEPGSKEQESNNGCVAGWDVMPSVQSTYEENRMSTARMLRSYQGALPFQRLYIHTNNRLNCVDNAQPSRREFRQTTTCAYSLAFLLLLQLFESSYLLYS